MKTQVKIAYTEGTSAKWQKRNDAINKVDATQQIRNDIIKNIHMKSQVKIAYKEGTSAKCRKRNDVIIKC